MKRLRTFAARYVLWLAYRHPDIARLVWLALDLMRIKLGRLALRGGRGGSLGLPSGCSGRSCGRRDLRPRLDHARELASAPQGDGRQHGAAMGLGAGEAGRAGEGRVQSGPGAETTPNLGPYPSRPRSLNCNPMGTTSRGGVRYLYKGSVLNMTA
jgi:hypothetical protein